MIIKKFMVGSDPEMFIVNKETGEVVSSIGLIPGEKGKPWVDKAWPEGFGLEIDNVLAEFNIPPVSTKEDFIKNMNFMKEYIREFVKRVDPKLDILCAASKIVPEDQLNHPIAKLFGCSVDYNAYTENPNPKPKGELTNLRSAGEHIHFSYNNFNVESSLYLIKLFDIFLGLPSIIFDRDRKRRSLYGKAGCFRLTPYGFEYRVLSAKMYSTDELMSITWDGIISAISAFNSGFSYNEGNVIKAINTSNKKLAIEILQDILGIHISKTIDMFITGILEES